MPYCPVTHMIRRPTVPIRIILCQPVDQVISQTTILFHKLQISWSGNKKWKRRLRAFTFSAVVRIGFGATRLPGSTFVIVRITIEWSHRVKEWEPRRVRARIKLMSPARPSWTSTTNHRRGSFGWNLFERTSATCATSFANRFRSVTATRLQVPNV